MTIDENQRVGIGTTSPSDKLTILGSAATTFQGGGIYNSYTYGNADKAESRFNLGKIEGSTYQPMGSIGAFPVNNTDSANGILSFYTRTSQSVTEKMRITDGGNVGIGTTSPGAKLEIYGSGSTSSSVALSVRNAVGTKLVNVFDDGLIQLNNLLNASQVIYINSGDCNRHYAQDAHIFHVVDNAFQRVEFVTIKGNLQSPAMGVGTMSPNTSAILDLTSRSKGFLPPRMTNSEMVAISSPAAGLVVYDTTNNKLTVYNGSGWVPLH
jgi:hypothetical protein